MEIKERTNNHLLIVGLLIFVHLLIAIPLAYYLNIWNDEASSLYATQNGFWVAFQTAAVEQKQAPLYFWLLSFWRMVNDSIFFARLFSIICSVAAIWLFSKLAGRLVHPRAALLATAFFALHPVLIWASVEIRVYSLVILLSLGLLHTFLEAFWENTESRLAPVVRFAILAIIALHTNFYLGAMLAGFLIPLLVFSRWRAALRYIGAMAIVGLVFLPMALFVQAEMTARSNAFIEERSLIAGLKILWNHVLTYLLPTEIFSTGETPLISVARLWVVRIALIMIAGLAIIRRRFVSSHTIVLGMMVVSILGFLLAAYFAVGSWLVAIRHASLLFAPLVLLFASLLNDLSSEDVVARRVNRFAAAVFSTLVLTGFTYTLVNLYPNFTKRGDWARVGQFIKNNERPNQSIIIFHTYDAIALPYHYDGINRILPEEKFFEFDFGSPTRESIKARTAFTVSKIPGDAAEIWLLLNSECDTPGICESFEDFVSANYTIEIEQHFADQKVFLLKKRGS